jgi:hypothetical protein
MTGRNRFFSHARWSSQALALAKLIVSLLVPDGQPVLVAIDDTLFKRTAQREPELHLPRTAWCGWTWRAPGSWVRP